MTKPIIIFRNFVRMGLWNQHDTNN